ncbi:MAG TPA: DNA polymerase/3'-5' exonuclease PolX, partial [Vicinamibacteria bacterium]
AADTVAACRVDLGALSEKELTAIDGVGPSTARKIREFYENGTITKLEELRRKYPPEFVELGTIPGLGPKTLLRLRNELGVRNLDDLRQALEGQRVRGVRGLGEKAEQKLRLATARMGQAGKDRRRPIAQAMPIARELVRALEALPGVERAQCCGSLRRLRETVADVDIVVASREAASVREAFLALPMVREAIGSGDTKTSVLTATGLQVDLRIVEPRQFGAACQYFTGSKAHNIRLRQRALARGLVLNEYGLSDAQTGEVIASETEEAIYRALGLPLVPPPMREDRGEIELAETGGLPGEVRLEDVRGDLHVHTTLSGDGRSPLEEIVAAAAARGYEYLAITDHAEDLAMSGASRAELTLQRGEVERLRGRNPGMTLLHGSELNIGRDGGVDYDAAFRRTLDWCVAGVHSHFDLGEAEQTRRILAAMDDPTVDAIAHLTGRRIGHRPGIELDTGAVLRKAALTGTAIEINAALGRLDASSDVLLQARGMDVTFVIGSDTHHARELGRMEWGVQQATRGWVEPSRIANLWPRDRFLGWLRGRRSRPQP